LNPPALNPERNEDYPNAKRDALKAEKLKTAAQEEVIVEIDAFLFLEGEYEDEEDEVLCAIFGRNPRSRIPFGSHACSLEARAGV
jgi:hypothetical protein